MLIVAPDFARRIDLPGAGPCPRPVDIDRTKAALTALVSLRVYSFARGTTIDGEAEGDEVFIVLMRGACDVVVTQDGAEAGRFALRVDGGPRALYMPPRSSYRLSAVADCDIAYARCDPVGAPPPVAGFAGRGGRLDVAAHAGGMELALETLAPGASHAIVAAGGRTPERFVHVRSDSGAVRVGDARLGDWGAMILAEGDIAVAEIDGGRIDVLTISARER